MAKFNIDKKGYNTEEVDEYIKNLYIKYEDKLAEQKDRVVALKNEVEILNEKLNGFLNKDEQISKALIYAVEKSEQIENNAKTVYNLEIKRINALYSRWEELLLQIENKCPEINQNRYINSLMKDFKQSISEINEKSLSFDTKSIKDDLKQNSDNFIKNILNRMDYAVNSKPVSVVTKPKKVIKPEPEKIEPKKQINEVKEEQTNLNKTSEVKKPVLEKKTLVFDAKSLELKNTAAAKEKTETKTVVTNKTTEPKPAPKGLMAMNSISSRLSKLSSKNDSQKVTAESYLNSEEDLKINAYAKNFAKKKLEKKNSSPFNYMTYPEPNESGFDLKEALNPKEDLDEIMKSFDFFDED